MTLHLTYVYLWVFLGVIWLAGCFIGSTIAALGNSHWYERLAVVFWPVTLPLVLVFMFFRAIFWPEY